MTVKGAFSVDLSGPYEARAGLLEAFAEASISARYASPSATGLDEESKGWVCAEFHEGTDSPSAEFQHECLSRATALGERFGYVLRSYGVVVGAAAQLSHVVDTRTGALVIKAFNMTEDGLASIADQFGVPVEFLQIQESPGLWNLPDA
ncbi:hypothetical protein [Streptomyces sp. st170]|uniref:hypothetical protein n=1 Tax=Streptomyces sp. st170 TaxID=1828058 RepID=UPI00117DEF28|nr:hypothetical protein [Streptomyces sp. st170]